MPSIIKAPHPGIAMSYSENLRATRHRSRLSHSDVKLILFLIVQIKPFKYVGDRTLSQSRKWDLIQQKLEQLKIRNFLTPSAVPTVRTLQRQMATALRKAQHRHLADNYEPFLVFTTLSKTSPLADLELAVLELYNLSEAYKTGQTVGPLPELVSQVLEDESLKDLAIDSTDTELAPPPLVRHNSDASYQSHMSFASAELAGDHDDSEVPESVAPIVSKIRLLVEQNRSFYSDCMAMLRLHSLMMNERCLKLEKYVIASARDPIPHTNSKHVAPVKVEAHNVGGSPSSGPQLTSVDMQHKLPHELASRDRVLRSILQLLN